MKNTLSNVSIENCKDYMDDFLPSLSNFCAKSPLNISIRYVEDLKKVFLKYNDRILDVDIDINRSKHEIIKDIKNQIIKDYPLIYEKTVRLPTADEVERKISQGMSISEALESTECEYTARFRIMRKHDKYNELDLYDLNEKALYKYKSKIPVTALIKMVEYRDDSVLSNLSVIYKIEKKENFENRNRNNQQFNK